MVSYTCPATTLAKSLLDVWLSGDQRRLRLELRNVGQISLLSGSEDSCDRFELLKSIAGRMRESPDLFASRSESPRLGTWFDLLHHLSGQSTFVN